MQASGGIYLNFPKNAVRYGLPSSLSRTEENHSLNHCEINLVKCVEDPRIVVGPRCNKIIREEMQNVPSIGSS